MERQSVTAATTAPTREPRHQRRKQTTWLPETTRTWIVPARRKASSVRQEVWRLSRTPCSASRLRNPVVRSGLKSRLRAMRVRRSRWRAGHLRQLDHRRVPDESPCRRAAERPASKRLPGCGPAKGVMRPTMTTSSPPGNQPLKRLGTTRPSVIVGDAQPPRLPSHGGGDLATYLPAQTRSTVLAAAASGVPGERPVARLGAGGRWLDPTPGRQGDGVTHGASHQRRDRCQPRRHCR